MCAGDKARSLESSTGALLSCALATRLAPLKAQQEIVPSIFLVLEMQWQVVLASA
jgi:hypothetical protein